MENDNTMGVGTTVQHTDNNQSITWEDVIAVCKLMGVKHEWDGVELTVYRPHGIFGVTFSSPSDTLEHISAPEHPLEQKYDNILRTKP